MSFSFCHDALNIKKKDTGTFWGVRTPWQTASVKRARRKCGACFPKGRSLY